MRRVEWEPKARADLAKIVEYFADKDERAAALLLERIGEAARGLGRFDTGRPGRMPELREKSVPRTRYILAYRRFARRIVILRVIHTSQHWTKEGWP